MAIREVVVIDNEGFRIPTRFVTRDAVDEELLHMQHAFDSVAADISRNQTRISNQLGQQYGAIFAAPPANASGSDIGQ